MIAFWVHLNQRLEAWLRGPQDILLLGLRLWLAWIFLKSGLLKFQSWEVTLELFAYEYAVPVLPPVWAAVMATAAELLLPPLLALGVLTRPVAMGLLVLNVIATIAYPDISAAGLKDHQLWGLALAGLCLLGAGRLSVDEGLTGWERAHS